MCYQIPAPKVLGAKHISNLDCCLHAILNDTCSNNDSNNDNGNDIHNCNDNNNIITMVYHYNDNGNDNTVMTMVIIL